jgi:hypothetical protein
MTTDYITPQERQDYGEEFLNVVAKQARAAAAPDLQQLQRGMAEVQQTLHATQRRQMARLLDERLAEWRSINTDPGFLSWLAERDQFSGMTRQALLDQAWQSGAGERVLNIFAAYRASGGGPGRPGAARQPGASGRGGKRVILAKEITQFHDDVRRGRYVGREKEKEAFDREMIEAAAEGRIVG